MDRGKLRHIPQSKIDELLASDEFTEYWTHQLGQWLRIGPAGSSEANSRSYHDWLHDNIAQERPLDEIARALVTSAGADGPANFYRAAPDARGQAEHFSEVLMGVRLRCANCHNHPLDRWTQDDYHGLAAIFSRLERGKEIRYIGRGQVSHPATGEAATPKLPGGAFLPSEGDQRQALAQWLVDESNPQFARAIVNRLWHAMLGRGLVEPIDDFRATNPATHPRLLERLTEDFIAHDYDLRHTLRLIATSATYARSSAPLARNAIDDRYYSHALRKPLSAEVLLDAMIGVTDVHLEEDGLQSMRMIHVSGPAVEVPELEVLGRCDRKASCSTGSGASNISRELALLNGSLLNRRIASPQGRVAALLRQEKSNEEIVGEFYQRALSRSPTNEELDFWQEELASSPENRRAALEDFLWSLLSCHEFTHRH